MKPSCLTFAACAALAAALASCGGAPGPAAVSDPLAYADPRMGSGGYAYAYGSAFPGASGPNGMMRVGPDTTGPLGTLNFQHYSGYWSEDTTVLGFTHMHLHGTGATDYGVLAVMPVVSFDPTRLRTESLQIGFDKTTEQASPGSYSVILDNDIQCDFTARGHSAHERFTFPGDGAGTLQFDLARILTGSVTGASLAMDADGQGFTGQLSTSGGMSGGFTLYFAARFLRAPAANHLYSDASAPAAGTSAAGTNVGAAFDFAAGEPVELQLALSLVSADGAKANLAAELPSADYATNLAAARADWRARLQAITVYGGIDADRATFYSALHHAFVMPGEYSDTDGNYRYRGTVAAASGHRFVTDLSLWDTYRTLNPLYGLIAPDRALDVSASLWAMARIDGAFPKWPLATSDSGSMIGASAEVVLADAYVKGATGYDAESAYQLLRAAALSADPGVNRGGRSEAVEYMTLGYVPADLHGGAVSKTLEYAADDTALANFAAALNHADDAAALRARAQGYRKLFDSSTGFLRAHDADGALSARPGFNPSEWDDDYVEGDARQYTWAPIHDPQGLASLYGGAAQLLGALATFYGDSQAEYAADITAAGSDDGLDQLTQARNLPMAYYWAGNEIDLNAPLQFAVQDQPAQSAAWLVWARTHFFSSAPSGLPGNDDGGTMSAFYLFSALGIFPLAGSDQYVIGSPLFPRADIAVSGGVFSIQANGLSAANIYVQSARLNGSPLQSAILSQSDMKAGGSLVLEMGAAPGSWGTSR